MAALRRALLAALVLFVQVLVPASALSPAGAGAAFTFLPSADTFVQSGTTIDHGAWWTVRARVDGPVLRSYLRFTVRGLGGPAGSARLRLNVTDPSTTAVAVYRAGNAWNEHDLTFATRPLLTGARLSALSPAKAATVVEADVTSAVTGDGTFTLALVGLGADMAIDPSIVVETEAFYAAWAARAGALTAAAEARGARVWWLDNPPLLQPNWYAPHWDDRARRLTTIHRALADTHPQLGYVDALAPFGGPTIDMSLRDPDGVHMNQAGNRLLADLVVTAVSG